jgi:hypothetical protein
MCIACFSTLKLCILATEYVFVFHIVLAKKTIICLNSINRFVFVAEMLSVSCSRRCIFIYYLELNQPLKVPYF